MKKIDEILKPKRIANKTFVRKLYAQLREYAMEAHRMDNSKPVSYFYELFLDRARKNYFESKNKAAFFEDNVIEN